MIRIKNLFKKFGNRTVLQSINLELERGKIYGLVGANGAGKTTLFRCITGLEKYEGLVESDFQTLKDHIGFLTTEPYFLSKITGREYIQLLANARSKKLENVDEKNIFDLPLDQYASTYSTGMKKKLALMAVLFQENDVFILDEPFNGVDIHSNLIITELIKKLKSMEKTVLISSHIFSTLVETCEVIYLLQDGEISKTVQKGEFQKLEEEMKNFSVGNRIENLDLS